MLEAEKCDRSFMEHTLAEHTLNAMEQIFPPLIRLNSTQLELVGCEQFGTHDPIALANTIDANTTLSVTAS
mgnify:CR=1 FL=1